MDKKKLKDEIDFKDFLKEPIRLFGWVFPLIIVLSIIVGRFYIKSINDVSFNEVKPVVERFTYIDKEMKKGATLPAVSLGLIKNAPEELILKGKDLYEKTCASCHGSRGLGDGPAGTSLDPKPRNFTQKEGWTNSRNMLGMYMTLQEGIVKNGMAAYEYIISEDRLAILHYIRTLGDFTEITDDQVQELDLTYNLSKEITTANQIPVKLAEEKIIDEFQKLTDRKKEIEELINSGHVGSESIIENSSNLKKIVNVFLNSPDFVDYTIFKECVVENPVNFGFKAKVARLNEKELKQLHSSLVDVMKIKTDKI